MRGVAILGVGQTPVREHWDISLRALAVEAGRAALADAGVEQVDAIYVSNMNSGELNGQRHLGVLIADWVGLRGVEAVKVEAACGSGGRRMRAGLWPWRAAPWSACGRRRGEDDRHGRQPDHRRPGHRRRRRLGGGPGLSLWPSTPWSCAAICTPTAGSTGLRALLHQRPRQRRAQPLRPPARAHLRSATTTAPAWWPTPSICSTPRPSATAPAAACRWSPEQGRPLITIAGSASATDSLAVHDRRDPLWLRPPPNAAAQGLCPGRASAPPTSRSFRAARCLLDHGRAVTGGLRLRRARPGPAPGPRRPHRPRRPPAPSPPAAALRRAATPSAPPACTRSSRSFSSCAARPAAPRCRTSPAFGMAQNIGGSGATIVTHILKN